MSPTSYQAAPPRDICMYCSLLCLGRVSGSVFRHIRAVYQFDQSHGRIVANTETHLQDTGVATRTSLVAWTDFSEQLDDHVAVAQAVECQALVGQRGFFAQGD